MNEKNERGKIDWMITLLPLGIVIALCVLFFFVPEQSNAVLSQIRFLELIIWSLDLEYLSFHCILQFPDTVILY